MLTNIEIRVSDDQWEQTGYPDGEDGPGDPSARLLSTISINGLQMHLEAIAVTTEDDQDAVDSSWQEDLEKLQHVCGCTFQTVTIMGREYVLYATPFGT